MNHVLEVTLAALTIAVPPLVYGAFALIRQWLRLRTARLRAERLRLPPSTDPPPTPSLDPRFHERRRRNHEKRR